MKTTFQWLVIMLCAIPCVAQVHQGDWGMGASIALPSGLSSMVVSNNGSGSGGPAIANASTFTYTGGSEFAYQFNSSMQFVAGLGIGLVSFATNSGTPANSQTTVSIALGVREYLKPGAEVSPYVGGNLSYTIIPTVNKGAGDVSGSLFMIGGCFGVEAFIAKHAALFSQMGIGYTSGSASLKTTGVTGTTMSGSVGTLSLGGSAIGFHLYW